MLESKKSDSNSSQTDQTAADWKADGYAAGLANRIWKRCGDTSGIAIRRFCLALDRRRPLVSNDRLPLLGALQKRWGPANDIYSGLPSISVYAWPWRPADSRYAGGSSGPMRFSSQSGGDVTGNIEPVRLPGEEKGAKSRPLAADTPPGAESVRLHAHTDGWREQPPAGTHIGGRLEAPIVQRRKRPAADPDSKVATAMLLRAPPQEKRISGAGSAPDIAGSAKTPVTAASLRPTAGSLATAIIRRVRHQPLSRKRLSTAGPAQPPHSTVKGRDAAGVQEKIAETKDNTGASFQRATVKTTTDSLLQRLNRPGRPPMPLPVIGAGGTHPDSPGNVSAATGFAGPSTATETGNDLAAKIMLRHGSMPAGRLSEAKAERLRLSAAMNGRIAPDTDLPLPSERSGSEITVSGKFASLPPRGPSRSVAGSMTRPALSRLSSGYHDPTMAAGQPSRIVGAETRQPLWLHQSASFGSLPVGIIQTGQAAGPARIDDKTLPSTDMRSADEVSVRSFAHGHAAAGAFAGNRIWPQMMIHRAFVTAGVAGSSSGASEHPVHNSSGSVANRPLAAMRTMRLRGFDAMSLTMNTGRLFHSTAGDPSSRSLVQLSASDRPALAEGRLMRSSESQFGSVLDGESRPREPHDGGSENNPSGSADLEQLVDKVLQKLMRRIAVEKERRGLQRWP